MTNGFAQHVMDLWAVRETKIVYSGTALILQLLCYNKFKGAVIKNNMRVNCYSLTLKLPISADK